VFIIKSKKDPHLSSTKLLELRRQSSPAKLAFLRETRCTLSCTSMVIKTSQEYSLTYLTTAGERISIDASSDILGPTPLNSTRLSNQKESNLTLRRIQNSQANKLKLNHPPRFNSPLNLQNPNPKLKFFPMSCLLKTRLSRKERFYRHLLSSS